MRSPGKVDCGTAFSIIAILLISVADLVTGQTCGGDLSDSGNLLLSNVNSPYPRNCTWNLAATAGKAVNLQLTTYTTYNFGNLLQIYSGDVLVFEYPGLFQPINLVLSSTAKVVLLIQTGMNFQFSASFTSDDPACSQASFLYWYSVWTPNFPQPYPQPFNCTWQIDLIPAPFLKNLLDFTVVNEDAVFGTLELSSSTNGQVTTSFTTSDDVPKPPAITVGASTSLFFNGTGCRKGFNVKPNGKALGLYNSEACREATGFLAEFSSRQAYFSCDVNITDEGNFTTLGFPTGYPPLSSCVFVLTASPRHRVNLTFDTLNVTYPYDSVRLYSDGVFVDRYSGAYDPFTKVLGSVVTVEFISNIFIAAPPAGVSASFTSV